MKGDYLQTAGRRERQGGRARDAGGEGAGRSNARGGGSRRLGRRYPSGVGVKSHGPVTTTVLGGIVGAGVDGALGWVESPAGGTDVVVTVTLDTVLDTGEVIVVALTVLDTGEGCDVAGGDEFGGEGTGGLLVKETPLVLVAVDIGSDRRRRRSGCTLGDGETRSVCHSGENGEGDEGLHREGMWGEVGRRERLVGEEGVEGVEGGEAGG